MCDEKFFGSTSSQTSSQRQPLAAQRVKGLKRFCDESDDKFNREYTNV